MKTSNAGSPGVPATCGTSPDTAERELSIHIFLDFQVNYEGSSAQLVSEGLIPANFEWPVRTHQKAWQAGGFDYWIQRCRPEGHKGPMKSWLELDHWCIRVTVTGRDWRWRAQGAINRKREELRLMVHRNSAAGIAENTARCARASAALADTRFQAMLERVLPSTKKRGRPSAASRLAAASTVGSMLEGSRGNGGAHA